jgi:hypothetical protein
MPAQRTIPSALTGIRQEAGLWRDIRHAAPTLVRTPLFTLAATLARGFAIGANATIFSLVGGLWLRPPGVRDAGAIVRV